MKRTLFLSQKVHLRLHHHNLHLKSETQDQVHPIIDIGTLIIANPAITLTAALLAKLAEVKAVVVFCNTKYQPTALTFPLTGHVLQQQRVQRQIHLPQSEKENITHLLLAKKIDNQARLLKKIGQKEVAQRLFQSQKEASKTPLQQEGWAAQYYWKHLFPFPFQRERQADYPNSLLDFGYTLLQSLVTRIIVSHGFLPMIGLHHHNPYNSLCLAHDLMEPYRPFIDERVFHFMTTLSPPYPETLTPDVKKFLLLFPLAPTLWGKRTIPLEEAIKRSIALIVKRYQQHHTPLVFGSLPYVNRPQ